MTSTECEVQPELPGMVADNLGGMPWGGARPGSGPKPRPDRPAQETISVRVPPDLREWIEKQGGSAWVREKLLELRKQDSIDGNSIEVTPE